MEKDWDYIAKLEKAIKQKKPADTNTYGLIK